MGTHTHNWSKTQLTTEFKGVVTLKDIFASSDERVGDERFDSIEFVLNDFTQVDEISGSLLDVSNALTYFNQSKLFGIEIMCLSPFWPLKSRSDIGRLQSP